MHVPREKRVGKSGRGKVGGDITGLRSRCRCRKCKVSLCFRWVKKGEDVAPPGGSLSYFEVGNLIANL